MKNKIIDHHVHTHYSPDASKKATMTDYITQAKSLELSGVMFTDHVDFDSPDPLFDQMIDYNLYEKEILMLKNKTNLNIFMGVEIGYQPHLHERYERLLSSHPFDFVINSIHSCDGLDLYNGDFFKGKNQNESYERYLEIILESVKHFQGYDVYGHLDYIIRYGNFVDKTLQVHLFQELIDEILKTIIINGKGIELNTSGIRKGLGVMHPKLDILKRYKELGGEIITIGSDAHQVKDLYAHIEDAKALLKEAGFKYVMEFKSRHYTGIKLD